MNVALEGPAPGLELRAIDADTEQEIEADSGTQAASVRLCACDGSAKGTLNLRIELRSTSSTGRALLATRLLAPAE